MLKFNKKKLPELSETSDLIRKNKSIGGDIISKTREFADNALDIKSLERSIRDFSGFYAQKGSKGMVLAGLEKKVLIHGFEIYVKSGVYDIMMPDIKYAGGPDELIALEKLFYPLH